MKIGQVACQGDVLIRRVAKAPKSRGEKLKFDKKDQVILEYGEVTGHMHQIISPGAELFAVNEGLKFLELKSESVLKHDEHADICLDAGYYEVIRQREYFPSGWQAVAD